MDKSCATCAFTYCQCGKDYCPKHMDKHEVAELAERLDKERWERCGATSGYRATEREAAEAWNRRMENEQ